MIMEHSIAASSNCINGDYHMYKDHLLLHCKSTAEGGHENNIPLFHSNMHDASMCVSEDGPVLHGHAGCTVDPFPREGHGMRASIHNRDDASSLHEPNDIHDNSNDETMRAHIPPVALTDSSPQALLDIIVYAQKQLRQLQAIAETMVQVAGQAQQQQSLVTGMKSIMSQLHIATAGVCTQPAPCSKQDLGSARSQLDRAPNAQFSQALDLSFDNFHSYGMNISNLPPLGSILGAPSESLFSASPCSELTQSTMEFVHMRNASAPQLSAMMGPNITSLAMERVCMRGLCGSKLSGIKHPKLQKQSLNSIVGDLVNHRRPSNASDVLAESESASIVMETLDSHGTHDNRNQEIFGLEDHDYASVFRDDDDDDVEGENLPPGSYELVEMAAAEILAEHTHFCEICGKGFKRDANLRMHMRGHGDEYKSPAALARPSKCLQGPAVKLRRYSCPYQGCKRNKKHRKFQPLKTTLCVKNHYRRTHCPKLLICSKCKTKRFSVVADLKTHEKHCGQDKWQCSCGTTFSRKDKLAGHVSLFAGHTPAVPMHEIESLDENLFDSLPAGDGKGAEGLPTSKPSNFGMVESFHALPENELTLTTTLMAESDDGNGISNVAIMGKEVLS